MNNGRRIAWPTILAVTAIITITGTIVLIVVPLINKITGPLEWLKANVDNPRQLYLLSATAQVLAALFALVFSITLIAVQFVTKYTHRTMRIVFTGRVIVYMGGFALAVVLPLWFISHPTGWGSLVSVIIGSLYVLSLVGFFLYLRDRMKIDGIITYLKEEGLKAVERNDFDKAEGNISALDGIGTGSYTDRNFEVFAMAEEAIADIVLEIENDELLLEVLEMFEDTCVGTIADRRAPKLVIKHLGRIGVDAIKSDKVSLWQILGELFLRIESWCNNTGRKHVSLACTNALHEMVMNATPFSLSEELRKKGKLRDDDLIAPNPYAFLLNSEVNIYQRHIEKGWEDLWLEYMERTKELVLVQLKQSEYFNEKPLFFLFDLFDKFITEDFSHWGNQFMDSMKEIRAEIKKPSFTTKNIMEGLIDGYKINAGECYKKQSPHWHNIGDWMYKEIAHIAEWAVENKEYELAAKAQSIYLPALEHVRFSGTADELVSSAVKQTQQLAEEAPERFNDERASIVISGFCKEARGKTYKQIKDYWGSIQPAIESLLKLSLAQSYKNVLRNLNSLIQDNIIWGAPEYLPSKDVNQFFWLILAAFVNQGLEEEIPWNGLVKKIYGKPEGKNIAVYFFREYANALKLGEEYGISNDVCTVQSLINQERNRLQLPRYS